MVEALITLARIKKDKDYLEAKILAEKAINEAGKLNDANLRAKAYVVMAEVEEVNHNFDSVIVLCNLAIELFDPQSEKFLRAKSLNQRGIAYENKGLYTKAYESYIGALRLYDELKDEKGICNEYLNIGLIHQYKKEFKQAEKYFNQALAIAERTQYSNGIGSAYNNLGITHKEQKHFDIASNYFRKVLEIDLKEGNEANISYSLNNLGTINADMGRHEIALGYYNKSMVLKKKLGDAVGLANTYNNIGAALIALKRIPEAEKVLKEAYQLSRQYGLRNTIVETYQHLSELESARKNYQKALEYYLQFDAIKDSLELSQSSITIHDLESQYKLDKANAELAHKNAKIETEFTLRILFITIIILLAILSLYFLYSIRHTNKLSKILNQQNTDLIRAKENAEKATNAKTQFLSVMSHEIRTPLNAIIGIANILNDDLTNELHRKNIAVLRIASQNLLHLINDLLDLNKLEVGKMEAESAQLNVRKVIESIKEMFAVSASQKGLELKVEFDYTIPTALMGDETKLNQAITNLISNAIKFTEKGYVKITARVQKITTEAATIEFVVSDTGIGIPEDKQQTIFESFAQAASDTNRKYGGTGLGLAISKKLIEVMGGKLLVQSQPNKGSMFSFTLTLLQDQVSYEKPNIEVSNDGSLFKGKSILIADDNAVNIFVLKQFLKKWGVNIVEAANGLEAVKMMYEHSFDLVLMDVQMPIKDGIDATIDIRNAGKPWSAIPIIAITASHEDEVRVKIKECGMNDFIIKPFMPDDLIAKLSNYL